MKKTICFLLIAVLLLPTAAFAASSSDVTITRLEFDMIEELMMEQNPTIIINDDTLETLINNRNSLKGMDEDLEEDLDESLDSLDAQIEELENLLAGLEANPVLSSDEPLGGTDPSVYAAVKATYTDLIDTLNQSINSLKSSKSSIRAQMQGQIDSLPDQEISLDKSIKQIHMANNQLIWAAQSMFMGYHSLERQYEELCSNLNLMDKQYRVMQLQYDLGMISAFDLTSFENQLEGLRETVKGLEKQKQYMLGEINLMLGQKFDSPIEIGNIPAVDKEKLSSMNYDEDLETVMEKSYSRIFKVYDYELKDNAMERAEDQHGDLSDEYEEAEKQYQAAVINLDMEEKKIALAFHKCFQSVKDKEKALDLEEAKLEFEKQKLDMARLKYELGMISGMERDQAEAAYLSQVLKTEGAKQGLLEAWLKYEWMLKGMNL